MRLVTAHWELKLVALVLAVALWIYTSGQVRSVRPLAVVVRDDAVLAVPRDHRVTSVTPREFTVRLSVPDAALTALPADTLALRLDLGRGERDERRVRFPLTSRLLGLGNDVRIEATDPPGIREVTVGIDPLAEAELAYARPDVQGLPDGIEAEVEVVPPTARMRGAASVIDRLRAAGAVPLPAVALSEPDRLLTGARLESFQRTPAAELGLEPLPPARVKVVLRPVIDARSDVALPLRISTPPDFYLRWRLAADLPDAVRATLRGARNRLKDLDPDAVSAYVTVQAPTAPGVQRLAVSFSGPPWLTVDPLDIAVTVTTATP